jgi:Uma2 family endonuclease
LDGTPDMVLEVVSPSSVEKDTVQLRHLYWQAGIREYWLVDARGPRLVFDILSYTPKGYAATRKQAGWLKSATFQRSFKLTHRTDHLGHPDYQLEISPPLK